MAGTTFFLAAATGHLMQNGDAIGARLRGTSAAPVTASAVVAVPAAVVSVESTAAAAPAKPVVLAGGLPDFPSAPVRELTSGVLLAARMDAVADAYERPVSAADETYSVFGIPCGASELTLTLGARGTLKAALSAPCHPTERVIFSHAGLSFAMMTDAAGSAAVTIPAMAANGAVSAAFANGDSLSAERQVPDLKALRRLAISGDGALRLNLFEDQAAYGSAGHFSAAQPGDPTAPGGAALVRLGDPDMDLPVIAEVFTAGDAAQSVTAEAEAETTAANCGDMVRARVITMVGGAAGLNETLVQAMPGCDAVGDLVLSPLPGWDGPLSVAAAN